MWLFANMFVRVWTPTNPNKLFSLRIVDTFLRGVSVQTLCRGIHLSNGRKHVASMGTSKLIKIKGCIMRDNNHLDNKWKMLIRAGSGEDAGLPGNYTASDRHGKHLKPPICWWNVKQHKGFSSSWHINYSEQLSFLTVRTTNCSIRAPLIRIH